MLEVPVYRETKRFAKLDRALYPAPIRAP